MKISIITVVLNNRTYIEDCIQSVLNQSYKNVEYIVIDGGSTDGTIDVIRKYEKHLSAWTSEPDRGLYDAMNKGLCLASGDVVGILNADDFYHDSDVLKDVMTVMVNPQTDACYADLVYVDPRNVKKIKRYWRSRPFEPGLFQKGWVPAHPTFFVRKNIYDQYGVFDLQFGLAADFELMVRLLEHHGIRAIYCPRVFVNMREGGVTNRSLKNVVRQNFEIINACRKNHIQIFPPVFLVNKIVTRIHQLYLRPVA